MVLLCTKMCLNIIVLSMYFVMQISFGSVIVAHPKMLSGVHPIFVGVQVNTFTDQVIIKLKGPWKNWFSVGFGNIIMKNTYSIVVEGDDGAIQERKLGDHNPGKQLKPSKNTYIINDETIFIDNKPVRVIEMEMDIDNGYFRFPTKSGERLDVIYGLGEEEKYRSIHFEKGVNFLDLYDIYKPPPPPSVNEILNRIEFEDDDKFGIEIYYDFRKYRNKAIYVKNGNMPRSVLVESFNYDNNDITISYISTGFVGNINIIFALSDENNDNVIDYDILLWKTTHDFVGGNGVNLAIDNTKNKNTLYVVDHIGIYKCKDNINKYVLDAIKNGHVEHLNDAPLLNAKTDCPLFLTIAYDGIWFHQQNYMKFNPKTGRLCFAMGVQCNICEHPVWESALHCIKDMQNPQFNDDNIVAFGVRNCVGFDFHPIDGKLWFSDNGRDLIDNDIPDGEINVVSSDNSTDKDYGFPYCFTDGRKCGDPHNRDGGCGGEYLFDPDFNLNGKTTDCTDTILPLQVTGPHSAPLGLTFYTGNMFPNKYKNALFLAIHGSWNRDIPLGYTLDVAFLNDDIDDIIDYKQFAKGWLDPFDKNVYGRPVDVDILPDGSMLLTDDFRNVIYRIYYGEQNKTPSKSYDTPSDKDPTKCNTDTNY